LQQSPFGRIDDIFEALAKLLGCRSMYGVKMKHFWHQFQNSPGDGITSILPSNLLVFVKHGLRSLTTRMKAVRSTSYSYVTVFSTSTIAQEAMWLFTAKHNPDAYLAQDTSKRPDVGFGGYLYVALVVDTVSPEALWRPYKQYSEQYRFARQGCFLELTVCFCTVIVSSWAFRLCLGSDQAACPKIGQAKYGVVDASGMFLTFDQYVRWLDVLVNTIS
jgi:hypothetical protein